MVDSVDRELNRKYYKRDRARKYYKKHRDKINQRSKDRWASMSPDERADYYERRKKRKRLNND